MHQTRQVGGPETPGEGHVLVCNGTQWEPVLQWDTATGRTLMRIAEDSTTCDADYIGAMRYADDCIEVCSADGWASLCGTGGGGSGDNTPNAFDFTDVTGAALGTAIPSNIVMIYGINTPSDVLIGGDGSPEYRLCSDSGCSTVAQNWGSTLSTITNGQYIQIRTTSSSYGLTTRTVNPVVIGTVSANWTVTTLDGYRYDFENNSLSGFSVAGGGWGVVPTGAFEGTYTAISSNAGQQNSTSDLNLTLTLSAPMTITFYSKVSSEACCDFLRFYIDGTQRGSWSGNSAWAPRSYTVTAGTHTFKWSYIKDGSSNSGSDTAWIDLVTLAP
ncbi:hypothetical protein [Micavibrio aeruginosavorus]|uniref:hypothetical protein n=1 Tax=Micavibrio aeruginosavorus TaxID=349221 RepID=UPI003F4ADC89